MKKQAEKSVKPSKDEQVKQAAILCEVIPQIAQKPKLWRKWAKISRELNARGLTTPEGKVWGAGGQNIKQFCGRYHLLEGPVPTDIIPPTLSPSLAESPPTPAPEPCNCVRATQTATHIDVQELQPPDPVLQEIVEWWRAGGKEMVMRNVTFEPESTDRSEPSYRPRFPANGKALA